MRERYLETRDWYKNLPQIRQLTPEEAKQWDNKPCCCSIPGQHLLHSAKNVIVSYDGGIWARQCAINLRMLQMMNALDDYESHIEDLEDDIKRQATKYIHLVEAANSITPYTSHLSNCKSVEYAAVGRKAPCSCGFERLDPDGLIWEMS